MSQLLKKFALLTACAVLALCFATRPAHAQEVTEVADGGTGEHLLFGYWSTANYMNTWIAVHSPLGVRNTGGRSDECRSRRQFGIRWATAQADFQYLSHARRLLDGGSLLSRSHGRGRRRM